MFVIWTAINPIESVDLIAFLLFYSAAIHLGTSSTSRLHYSVGPLPPTNQPRPFYFESVLGCFSDWLRTGRLKQKQILLLHGRKSQLKSRRLHSSIAATCTVIEHQRRQVVAKSASKIAIICLSIAARTLVSGKVCNSGRGKLLRRTHLLHPRFPGRPVCT